jgi:hypothetical protein
MSCKLRIGYSSAGGFDGAMEFAQGPAAGGHGLTAQDVEDGLSDHGDEGSKGDRNPLRET